MAITKVGNAALQAPLPFMKSFRNDLLNPFNVGFTAMSVAAGDQSLGEAAAGTVGGTLGFQAGSRAANALAPRLVNVGEAAKASSSRLSRGFGAVASKIGRSRSALGFALGIPAALAVAGPAMRLGAKMPLIKRVSPERVAQQEYARS